ncbi:MAG: ABC transporter ATP-binding protein [Firmicutes bacterium]|nr:ABC transporter ATP-binding protein [Bacillota bacterium]
MNNSKSKPLIQFQNIVQEFDGQVVLKGVSLDIFENEFVTLLGPSGCGKTTLLRILGGFLKQTEGKVIFDGKEISHIPPYKREVNTVFQKYALFPHLNVYDNIAFGLKLKKEPRDIIEQKVNRMLRLVNLEDYAKRGVNEMSGGQQQRVAIARALVNEPKVLLLDEPLGALDLKLRKEMQKELKKIQQEVGITFIFVTHDQEEALTMSDKIVVMKEGLICQIGSPTDVYNEPVSRYVANFIGESNIVSGIMKKDRLVYFANKNFECMDSGFAENEPVEIVIRPEDIDIVPVEEGKLTGVVKSRLFKGVHYETVVETRKGTSITVKMTVKKDEPVINGNEAISASDFYLDVSDIEELTVASITARAEAQAWDTQTEDFISISKVEYDILPQIGTYPVTFKTASGTEITVNMIVAEENKVVSDKYGEVIYAVNINKTIDDIKESIALGTDLKTWANAQAWTDDGEESIEITDVEYDFDSENIEPGEYDITFKTRGYEFKIDTTDKFEVGEKVGITFGPDDIHVMSLEGGY